MDILDAAEAAGKAIREISDQGYQRGLSEGRKQGLREAVSIMKRHPEGEGEWCDTGEDMEWACRSECVERAIKRITAALKEATDGKE